MQKTDIENLTDLLAKLPALGPRSARRAVLFLLKKKQTHLLPLINTLTKVMENTSQCPICGNIDTVIPCSVCSDLRRDKSQICVVADIADLWALERANTFKGTYHVLGGVLSALDGIGPEELNIMSLIGRIESGEVKEIILALPSTLDGQTTVHYLTDILEKYPVTITALSHGVPIGGELDYLDDGTLQVAFKSRHKI
ncbi:MAG: recombination protein RecR [Alphaproteobacteria bacterium]|nr:recombination protein RecR [Alphaproteobacteria bacterium]